MSPMLATKINAFKRNKRAFVAFVLFIIIFIVSLCSEFLANDKPLIVKYKGEVYFPIFKNYTDEFFGGDFPTLADYKDPIIVSNIRNNGWMIMPLIPFSYNTVDYEIDMPAPSSPDKIHWLGTDDEGRDIVARVLYGIRLSVIFAFILTFFSSIIGIFAGAVQGYFGGKTDIIMQRFIEIWESLPQLFILIIIASLFIPSFGLSC